MKKSIIGIIPLILLGLGQTVYSQDEEQLAKLLSNPIANLISFPIQADFDENIGPGDEGCFVLFTPIASISDGTV